MSAFEDAMKTKSMRKAARIFAKTMDITDPRAVDFVEIVFIAGAGWSWNQVSNQVSRMKEEAKLLCENNSVMTEKRKPL